MDMSKVSLFIRLSFLCVLSIASTTLISRPTDLNVVVGNIVVIQCQTDTTSYVRWKHVPVSNGDPYEQTVYWASGTVTNRYKDRYTVNKTDGWMNLTIINVSYNDAGQFICEDEDGEGQKESMNLNVFDTHLNCSHNMSSDEIIPDDVECSPGPDYINMTCSVSFSGNVPPVLQWIREGGHDVISNTTVLRSFVGIPSRAASTLLMTVKTKMNGSRYTCSIAPSLNSSSSLSSWANHSWRSDPLKILNLSSKDVDSLQDTNQPCPVSTNMNNCSYNWTSDHISEGQSTNQNRSCTTECSIRGTVTCRVNSFVIISRTDTSYVFYIIIGVILALVIVAVVIVSIIVKRRCFRSGSQSDDLKFDQYGIESSMENQKEIAEGLLGEAYNDNLPSLPLNSIHQQDMAARLLGEAYNDNLPSLSLNRIHLKIPQSEVSGVAALNKSLYILCRKPATIFCFSSDAPFSQFNTIDLSQSITDPNDMVACVKSSCLYIVCTNGEIYRIKIPDNIVERIDHIIEQPPHTLSVSSDGTLVIPHNKVKNERYSHKDVVAPDLLMLTVNENQTNTNLKRMISLPGEWKDLSGTTHRVKLHHAIWLESGNFLVSYGESCTYVCEVSSSGAFIKETNQAKLSDISSHLSQVGSKFIYVTRNEGIVKLNSDLKEIPTEREFNDDKLVKRETTRLCSFGDNSFLVGTKHDGAYIFTDSTVISSIDTESTDAESKGTFSTLIRLDVDSPLEVAGVDKLNHNLYVLYRRSPKLCSYDSKNPYELQDEIQLPGVKDPNDMAACPKNSCLYIICTNGEIYRVKVPEYTVVKLDLMVERPPYTLSVSSDGTLIIPQDRVTPDRYSHAYVVAPDLLMLTPEKNSIKLSKKVIISLPGEWKDQSNISHRVSLHHALQLKSGSFLMSYGEKHTYVCEISSGGAFIEHAKQDRFHGLPGHLITVQSEQNNDYFVYLTRNEEIIKLNSKLEKIVIDEEFKATELKKKEPTRLCYFGKNSFLIGTKHGGAYIINKSFLDNSHIDTTLAINSSSQNSV